MRLLLFTSFLLLWVSHRADAALLLAYNTANSNTSPTLPGAADPDLVAQSMRQDGGLSDSVNTTTSAWGWNGWRQPTPPTNPTNYNQAVALNRSWSWGFIVGTDVTVALDSMTFALRRESDGPLNLEIHAIVESGLTTTDTVLLQDTLANNSPKYFDVDLSSLVDLTQGDVITFRLAAWNADSQNGGDDLFLTQGVPSTAPSQANSLEVNGTVTTAAVPEPSTLLLTGLGSLGLVVLRRRRDVTVVA